VIDDEGIALGVTPANWVEAPYNRWAFRRISQVARTQRIGGSAAVIELPRAERDLGAFSFTHLGEVHTLDSLLAATSTDALIVLQDGVVITERYLDGMAPDDRHLLMSVSKSLTGVLCGVLVGQGLVSPGDLVTDHLPELAGTSWDGCLVQHLLDMRAGIAWDYEVDEYALLDVSDYRTHVPSDLPADTETWIRTIGRGPYAHGEGPFRYASLVTDVLAWVLERAGRASFPELFSREVWSAIGTEADAEIMVDASGFALAEGGICATLRDCARFGLMCLRDGAVEGRQIVPADWLGRLLVPDTELVEAYRSSAAADPATPGAMYHDTWWVRDPERGIFAASGMNGQLILVHRPSRVVIVKLSTYPGSLDLELFGLDHTGLVALCDSLA
jgi:CubicO group peptidase (beta-lactamase class C family)